MVLSIAFMYLCAVLLLIPYIGAIWLAFSGDRMREQAERSHAPIGEHPAVQAETSQHHRLARSA